MDDEAVILKKGYEGLINNTKQEVNERLERILQSLILREKNPSSGYLYVLADDFSRQVQWLNAKIFMLALLDHEIKKLENGKGNE